MAHVNEPPPPLPDDVPDGLRRAIAHALQKDPAARPADGAAFAAELRALGPAGRSTDDTRTRAVPSTAPIDVAGREVTAVGPVTATMPMPAPAVAQPHGRVPDGPDLPSPEDAGRGRAPLMIGLGLAVVVVLILLLVARDPGDADVDATATTPAAAATTGSPTTAPPATSATTAAPTTAAPADVTIDEAAYVGRSKGAVIDELESLGLTVVEEGVARPRGTRNNEVVGIEPNGQVDPGSTVVVLVAGGKKDR
jgi:serine/threonine-protein kinase